MTLMLSSLLFAMTNPAKATVWPSFQTQTTLCRQAVQMKDLNVPPVTGSLSTEIRHASIVYVSDRFVGFLYQTAEGKVFYHLGPVGQKLNVTSSDAVTAAKALGVRNIRGFQELQLDRLPFGVTSIVACY